MIWEGRVVHRDVEGGLWVLETERETFSLRGSVPRELSGKRVKVEGVIDDSFGFEMIYPVIKIDRVLRIEG